MWSAYVTLASQILLFMLLFYFSRNIVKFKFDIKYILKVLVFSILFFFSWKYFLENFSLWIYVDFFWYWTLFWILFVWFLVFLNRGILKDNISWI
jgi:hypothetical protein